MIKPNQVPYDLLADRNDKKNVKECKQQPGSTGQKIDKVNGFQRHILFVDDTLQVHQT